MMDAWNLEEVWDQMKREARESVRQFQRHVHHNPLPVALDTSRNVEMTSIFRVARLCEMPVPSTPEELQKRAVALKDVVDQLATALAEREQLRNTTMR
jgi:hypothetical protein